MSLIIPLPVIDSDVVDRIVLNDPTWDVMKRLVAASEALKSVPVERLAPQASLISAATDLIGIAMEQVADRLMPHFPDVLDDEVGDAAYDGDQPWM